jgi:hypothetical protein
LYGLKQIVPLSSGNDTLHVVNQKSIRTFYILQKLCINHSRAVNPYHVSERQESFFEFLNIGADYDSFTVFEIKKRVADIRLNHYDFGRKKL